MELEYMMARQKVARKTTSKKTQVWSQRPNVKIANAEKYLQYRDLQNTKDSEIVWVNSNWLKGLIPVASRCKNEGRRKEVLIQLYSALDRLKSERDVYVPMYMREVHTCMGNMSELPVNALKKVRPGDEIYLCEEMQNKQYKGTYYRSR